MSYEERLNSTPLELGDWLNSPLSGLESEGFYVDMWEVIEQLRRGGFVDSAPPDCVYKTATYVQDFNCKINSIVFMEARRKQIDGACEGIYRDILHLLIKEQLRDMRVEPPPFYEPEIWRGILMTLNTLPEFNSFTIQETYGFSDSCTPRTIDDKKSLERKGFWQELRDFPMQRDRILFDVYSSQLLEENT
jgi:hypothetical protein